MSFTTENIDIFNKRYFKGKKLNCLFQIQKFTPEFKISRLIKKYILFNIKFELFFFINFETDYSVHKKQFANILMFNNI